MSDDEIGGTPPANDGDPVPAGWRAAPAATYGLEHPVLCPACRQEITEIYVVRLYRTRVHFVSSLPRSGRLLVCPRCRAVVPGELGAVF
ncbi:MAG: hypothetical protein KDB94_02340 [Acidobacteria bacterium]|nr:hypothetical protein [Acidobacteriota bacterium]